MACIYRRFMTIALCLVLSSFASMTCWAADGQPPMLVGFGKVEVTPTEPVRLSGYSTRDKPHTAVADPLFARAMVLTQVKDQASVSAITPATTGTRTLVMVSVDSIAIVGSMTRQLEEKLQAAYGLARSDFVICSTHSHAAPQAAGGLNNIFRTPLSQEEQAAIDRHAAHVQAGILKAISQAMAARREATLELGQSTAAFAVNRRVLKNGLWTGFGKQADGPVDHRVQLIRGVSKDGKLLGAAFMYACHCTTLGPDFNQVSADWAGLSASALEKTHSDAVFLPIIGCGADANPEPRTGYEDAKRHGAAMASSIEAALKGQWQTLKQFPDGHFGYAGLAPEMPTRAELEAAKNDPSVTRRRWAESMLATLKKMGRLPETYPAPIHTWSFGKDLLWVFLGGEVVLDYQIRLEKNLPADRVWVAAYTDDVFAYVASERMRAEGGYEVDASMLYYNQPGRWQSGTEELIERRVREIFGQERADDKPTTPSQALKSIHVPPGFVVDMMAAEPLVNDPINIAFGHDGRVWVAEMSDYPLGTEEGGRVRWLRDSDGDGTLDQSQIFLSGLNYPSSVIPWRDGAIIITSPAIFFAADRDGDGQAELREELLQGIAQANPQHRASGFEIGLDGWLNFTSGDNTQELHSTRNGQRTNVSGRDVHWQPDTGVFTLTSGHTQYVRGRDEFNNWFGNVNNQPMFHYVVEDPYRRRAGLSGSAYQHLLDPPVAPPVLPASRTKDRFNDLHAFNRFTSACSSIICRVPGLGEEMRGAALVCEPVHNLVARFQVHQAGSSFVGQRFAQDTQFDFFASSDPFSRPVRVVNAPDGTLWIVDMVRLVIEHPQWIPTAWQDQLNLRAGTGLGRIYRVRREDFKPTALPLTDKMSDDELLKTLASDNGAARDLAAQQILWRSTASASPTLVQQLKALLTESQLPSVRAQVLGTLQGLSQVDQATLAIGLKDADPRVRRYAVTLAEPTLADASPNKPGSDLSALANLAGQEKDAGVLLQLALSLGGAANPAAHGLLESVA
ncbi:MAG: neutral/alkaline non-lysosomal ceramidase N-terminal domain-containing protein, partial [Pirellulaceae bacterium]|nr:neutral/alkaline non-lysosomal ceramidase N-terminal domain-containing protein [Pirellulaceae bacterium]